VPIGFKTEQARQNLLTWLVLGATVFCAHFVLVSQFGLYEDDYYYVLPWLNASSQELWKFCSDCFIHPSHSRPFLGPAQALLTIVVSRQAVWSSVI
jgi:hypothetical protein